MEQVITAIGSVGFPIVAYFLYVNRTEQILTKLTEAVNNNTIAVKEMKAKGE